MDGLQTPGHSHMDCFGAVQVHGQEWQSHAPATLTCMNQNSAHVVHRRSERRKMLSLWSRIRWSAPDRKVSFV